MPKTDSALNRRLFLAGATATAAVSRIRPVFAQMAPLKVGVLNPTSGYLAQMGQACNQGAETAVAVLKEMGYPDIQLMYGDSESNPDKARTATEKLIDGGAQMLMGALDSGLSAAIAQVAEQHGIPFVINIAAAPQITEQGYKFVFRNFPLAATIGAGSFELQKQLFAASGKTPTKCVVMHINDTFGMSFKAGLDALAPKQNMPYAFTDFIAYDPQARDLSVEVAKAKATGAEILWATTRLNDAIMITREMVKQRWAPWGIFSSGPGFYPTQYMKTLGKLSNYPISFVPWYDPRKPLAQKMIAAHDKLFPNTVVDTNTTYSFEALLICADAYKRAGSANPQALVEALKTTNIKDNVSVGGGVSFDAKGQNTTMTVAGIQNFDGASKVVLPVSSSEKEYVFPMPGWDARG